MKIRHIIPLALIAVIVSVLFGIGGSQTSEAQELEQFRGRLATYFADLEEAYPTVIAAGGPGEPLEQITEARQLIPELSAEELGVLRDAISQYPTWWDIPTMISLSFEPAAQGGAAQGSTGSTASLMSHSCPAPGPGGAFTGAQKHIEQYFLLEGLGLIADAILEALPQDTLAAIPRIAAAAVWAAAQTPALVQLALNEVNDVCEADNHRAILHDVVGPRVDVAVSSRASQTSLNTHDTNIDGDLVTHDTNIDGDLVAHDTNIDGDLIIHDGDVKALLGGVQVTLDTTTEMKRIHLQVIELPDEREYLVLADEAGVPVNVEFIGVQYSGDDPVAFVDVTASADATIVKLGIHRLLIDPEEDVDDIDSAKIWEFRVEHSHGSFTHFGVVLFIGDHDKNFAVGQ